MCCFSRESQRTCVFLTVDAVRDLIDVIEETDSGAGCPSEVGADWQKKPSFNLGWGKEMWRVELELPAEGWKDLLSFTKARRHRVNEGAPRIETSPPRGSSPHKVPACSKKKALKVSVFLCFMFPFPSPAVSVVSHSVCVDFLLHASHREVRF